MFDLLGSFFNLLWIFIGAPMLLGLVFLGLMGFIHLVMEKLNKSDLLNSLTNDYWWGMFLICWVVGVALFGFAYYWTYTF